MDIVPRFSFKYRGKPFDIADAKVESAEYGRKYTLAGGLTVELHIEEYPDRDAIKWTLWFENAGERDTGIISDIMDCDALWCLSEAGAASKKQVSIFDTTGNTSYESYLTEEDCSAEFSVHEKVLPTGLTRSYHPLGGRSASGQMPFFELYTEGRGLFAAIGWSGQWQASFAREDGDVIRIRSGLAYTAFRLHPGERIRTSSITRRRQSV